MAVGDVNGNGPPDVFIGIRRLQARLLISGALRPTSRQTTAPHTAPGQKTCQALETR